MQALLEASARGEVSSVEDEDDEEEEGDVNSDDSAGMEVAGGIIAPANTTDGSPMVGTPYGGRSASPMDTSGLHLLETATYLLEQALGDADRDGERDAEFVQRNGKRQHHPQQQQQPLQQQQQHQQHEGMRLRGRATALLPLPDGSRRMRRHSIAY